MDHSQSNTDMTREQAVIAAKKRLESFQFRRAGNKSSTPLQPLPTNQSHTRSHSKNSSISSLSFSNSSNSVMSSTSEMSSISSNSRPSSGTAGRPRPASHHRRRSSVSTRVESAEIMGVALPELPASSSDDNINFGDKDSIRRRVLWVLEGKSDLGLDSGTLEIPQLETSPVAQKPFDFSSTPSSFGLNNTIVCKRDSFGKMVCSSNSMKDQLQTLVEEEEEEEMEQDRVAADNQPPVAPAYSSHTSAARDVQSAREDLTPLTPLSCHSKIDEPEVSVITPSPARHRPTNLVLRPLSLLPNSTSPSLPTPSLTPSPRIAGLKSLTLSPLADDFTLPTPPSQGRRQSSLVLTPSPTPTNFASIRRQSMGCSPCPASTPIHSSQFGTKRQSSIGYIRSGSSPTPPPYAAACLPTPGATPTTEKRLSICSSVSDSESPAALERPLSANDHAFLSQSHAALLARIADLEYVLASRPRSRPTSVQSNFSVASSEPSDEMLNLVTDLKAERDELTRDVEGWRQRVADLERAKGVLERRVEAERREGWLKAGKLGLLEIEKDSLSRQLRGKEEELQSWATKMTEVKAQLDRTTRERDTVTRDLEDTKRQLADAKTVLEKGRNLEEELNLVKMALVTEKERREEMESQLDSAGLLNTPTPSSKVPAVFSKMTNGTQKTARVRSKGLGFRSTSSEGSFTDVECYDDRRSVTGLFTLKEIQEELEDDGHEEDEEDELARYEDEDDSDMSFMSTLRSLSTSSSFDDDQPRSSSHLYLGEQSVPTPAVPEPPSRSATNSPSPSPSPCPTPVVSPATLDDVEVSRANRAALSKAWTFPRGQPPPPPRQPEKVDRFFVCLEDLDNSPPSLPAVSNLGDKSLFSQGLRFMEDEDDELLPPFVIPSQHTNSSMPLDIVIEEEEEEEVQGEKVDGGLRFVFPPVVKNDTRLPSLPAIPAPAVTKADSSLIRTTAIPTLSPSTPVKPAFTFPASRPNAFATPPYNRSVPTARAVPPSRIPPPSPPRFSMQPAPTQKPSGIPPPKRKPVPVATFSAAPKPVAVAPKPSRALVDQPPKAFTFPSRSNAHTNGSTFIPQPRSPLNPFSPRRRK